MGLSCRPMGKMKSAFQQIKNEQEREKQAFRNKNRKKDKND